MDKFCLIDIGSTTTKTFLFRNNGGWEFVRTESPTTVEKPREDVTIGVAATLSDLETKTGESLLRDNRPAIPVFATSSAGGGLAMTVAGLVSNVTAQSAEMVAVGAGGIVQEVLALDDKRTPYKKIEMLKTLRPDIILLAGGFDGGSITGPVFLAELLQQARLRPKLGDDFKVPVIFAGNNDAAELVEETLQDHYSFIEAPNIRPSSHRENLEPARDAVHDCFMDHVMSRAPGFDRFVDWVEAAIMPTPAAVARILELASVDLDESILAIDIGGATTDVFTAHRGRVVRTVSANLGMSYSIINVVQQAGIDAVHELAGLDLDRQEVLSRIGNKYLNPTKLPDNVEDATIECAAAALAIRMAVAAHLGIVSQMTLSRDSADLGWKKFAGKLHARRSPLDPPDLSAYDSIIGSGGKLSHTPRDTAAAIMINGLRPHRAVKMAVDSAFILPQLGVFSQSDEQLAMELFKQCGLVELGTYKPSGRASGDGSFVDTARGNSAKSKAQKCGWPEQTVPESISGDDDSRTSRFRKGAFEEVRELSVPGEVVVRFGQKVNPDTELARCTQLFRRPFFVSVGSRLKLNGEQVEQILEFRVGEKVKKGDILVSGPQSQRRFEEPSSTRFGTFWTTMKSAFSILKEIQSTVTGVIERILPDGTLVIREEAEFSSNIYTINVVDELNIDRSDFKRCLRCEEGQEVEEAQIVAIDGLIGDFTAPRCVSPVRGKIKSIHPDFGGIIIEPMQTELTVPAWVPGTVTAVSDRGATIANEGIVIDGKWGHGPQVGGKLTCGNPREGDVIARRTIGAADVTELADAGVTGIIAGSLELSDLELLEPSISIVLTEGFGCRPMPDDLWMMLESSEGSYAALDPTTHLRAGVVRPRVVLVVQDR